MAPWRAADLRPLRAPIATLTLRNLYMCLLEISSQVTYRWGTLL